MRALSFEVIWLLASSTRLSKLADDVSIIDENSLRLEQLAKLEAFFC